MRPPICYDRRVDDSFLQHFLKGGVAHSLAIVAKHARYPVDLQMRRNPKTGAQHATLYVGLTAVLNVHAHRNGLRLTAHQHWKVKKHGWDRQWETAAALEEWQQVWPLVDLYLERVIPAATAEHGLTEGAVQAAVSASRRFRAVMLDREVVPAFTDTKTRERIRGECMQPLVSLLAAADLSYGRTPAKFGMECDLLAIANDGHLLAIEVKPLSAGTIAWVPAQAAMYALVLQRWADSDPQARDVIAGMLAQRQRLLGTRATPIDLPARLEVRPVVALQRGASRTHIDRMLHVRGLVDSANLGIPPVEVLEVSITGDPTPLGGEPS